MPSIFDDIVITPPPAPRFGPGVHFTTNSGSTYWHYGDRIVVTRRPDHPLGDELHIGVLRSSQLVVGKHAWIVWNDRSRVETSSVTDVGFHAIVMSPEVVR